MSMSTREQAIQSVKEYLINLLIQNDWCAARLVGAALEGLVNIKQLQTPLGRSQPNTDCSEGHERR